MTAICWIAVLAPPAHALPGDLDPSFGLDGWLFGFGSYGDAPSALAVQPDGKLVVAGARGRWMTVRRFLATGAPDSGFARDGIAAFTVGFGYRSSVASVEIGPGGDLLIGGSEGERGALLRLTSDGQLDPEFGGGDGVLTFAPTELRRSTIVDIEQSVGAIVVAIVEHERARFGEVRQTSFLARATPDGMLERDFGDAGRVATGRGMRPITIDSRSAIVVAGRASPDAFEVARYAMDGSADASFGDNGSIEHAMPRFSNPTGVAVDHAGRILLGLGPGSFARCTFWETRVVRLTGSGDLDADFAADEPIRGCFSLSTILPLVDGSIVLVGSVFAGGGSGEFHAYLRKVREDGVDDTEFGDGGAVIATPEPDFWLATIDAALQPDGKILLLARATDEPYYVLARFLAT